MVNSNNIYTIQTDITLNAQSIQIETLVTKGLYRFTLLGMSTKHASDTKDRVYSALRSSGLLNLKSDNRKIIVTLYPDGSPKKEGIYDLGIALSCIFCIDKKSFYSNILAVGGLSISGKIIPSKRIYQAIYTAYKENIPYIVCSKEDVELISKNTLEILEVYNITFIYADTLKEIVQILTNKNKNTDRLRIKDATIDGIETETQEKRKKEKNIKLENMNKTDAALYIALCGGHNLIIETNLSREFFETYQNILAYDLGRTFGQDIHLRYIKKLLDTDCYQSLQYIENLKTVDYKNILEKRIDSIIATYMYCPCGYQYNFFTTNRSEKKCICSRKSIIHHKRAVEQTYFSDFSMKTSYTSESFYQNQLIISNSILSNISHIRKKQFQRYMRKNQLSAKDSFFFPDNSYLNHHMPVDSILDSMNQENKDMWIMSGKNPHMLRVAQTIEDIFADESEHETDLDFISTNTKEKPVVSQRALLLALSYIARMDF